MNNELIESVPKIVEAIWNYYGKPRHEHLLHIPKTIEAPVAPGITCRMLTDAINRYIEQYPQEAIKHGLLVWFGELKCYQKSGEMDKEHKIFVSCIGRVYEMQDDGHLVELPHELVHHKSNTYWRYPFPWNKEPLQDVPEYEIDMHSLAPHRIVCYFPGNPIPKLWSKLFDARRNGIRKNMKKSGGDYYIIKYGQVQGVVKMTVERTKRDNVYPRDDTGEIIRHVGDHVFNDTAQEPGVHMWFDCRLVLPDINRLNNHSSTNNDRDCLSYPMPQPVGTGSPQQIQYDPWQYVQYTQYATHDPYRFDRTGDRAIRYYQQMIQQYFSCINNGCQPVDFDEYGWCEVMK